MQHRVRMTPSIQSLISLQNNQWVLYIITISHSVPWQFYMGSSPAMSQSIYTISYAWLILAMLSGQACLRGCRTKKWQIHKYSTAKLPTRIQFTYMYISLTNLVIVVLNLERIQVLIYTRNGSDLVLEHTVKVRGFSKQISLQLPIIRLFPIEGAMSHSSQWKCKCP